MRQLFSDIVGFMRNLNHIDLLLYFAILVLIILVVSLIYIVKTADDEEEPLDKFNKEDVDIKEIVSNIENAVPPTIDFTSYEKDQEEKSIISYEELLEKNKTGNINYNEEETIDDEVSVKKIDLEHMITANENVKAEQNDEKHLFKYTNEEAFLKALKALNELLN